MFDTGERLRQKQLPENSNGDAYFGSIAPEAKVAIKSCRCFDILFLNVFCDDDLMFCRRKRPENTFECNDKTVIVSFEKMYPV